MRKVAGGGPERALVERGGFWVCLFVVVSLAVMAGGAAYYKHEEGKAKQAGYRELAAIADLKIRQIVEWRQERLNDAQRIANNPLLSGIIAEWLRNPDNPDPGYALRERFSLELIGRTYRDALLVDRDARTLLCLRHVPEALPSATREAFETAAEQSEVVLSKLFRAWEKGPVYLDAVAPILDGRGRVIAGVILRAGADESLYPLIQSWPTPSPSAETLLVAADGEKVLFLNDLRHKENTALLMHSPLTATHLPAVQAVLGKTGRFEGADYRGREVLADLRSVPDSSWFMVAKVDREEILAEANYRAAVTGLIVALFILLTAAVSVYGYRRRQMGLYRDLYRTEQERREAEEEFRITIYGIGDAVITTDVQGCVRIMNAVAERLTGWQESEARGRPLEEVFHIVNEYTRNVVENPVQLVLREGLVVGLANHTLLISRDGGEHPIADSGAPIRLETGETVGVVLVFRDQSEERAAAKALHESETRLRTLVDAMREGVSLHEMVYDEEGKAVDYVIVSVNPAYEKHTGLPPARVLGKSARLAYATDVPPFLEQFAQVAETCRPIDFEAYFELLDRHFHISATSPKRGIFVTVFEDISERKRREEALQESEERYRQLFESESDAIFLIDDATDCIIEANSAASALYGYGREEFFMMTSRELLADSADTFAPVRHEISEPGEAVRIPLRFHRKKDGVEFPAEASGRFFSLHNRPAHLVAVRDVTERKRAEDLLRESEKRYRLFVETASEGIVAIDAQGRYSFVNRIMCDLLGYGMEEIIGQPVHTFAAEEDGESQEARKKALLQGISLKYEHRLVRKDGGPLWVIASVTPLIDEQGVYQGAFAMLTDITERKRAEEEREALESKLRQAQKMEAIGTLAGGIAHDFNNILSPIIGYTEMALNDPATGNRLRHGLEQILRAAIRARDLVRQILAFGRFGQEQQRVPLEIGAVAEEALRLLRASLPSSIEIRQDVEKSFCLADATQIHQVLINLCTNAAHAMDGQGVLEVGLRNVELREDDLADVAMADLKPGQHIRLSVADTGAGMDASILDRIFDPYFTTKEVGKGSGLGLAVVHGIVKRHEGAITVRSELGKGTTFVVFLPALATNAGVAGEAAETVERGEGNVLLVDDEPILIEVGTALLERLGYTVTAETVARDALETFQANPDRFDLLITDYTMPGMTGAELAKAFRQVRPDIPIMICTGFSEKITEDVARSLGVELIMKPFRLKRLSEIIGKLLG